MITKNSQDRSGPSLRRNKPGHRLVGDESERRMSIWSHIEELRSVIVYSLVFVGIGVLGVSVFAHDLYILLLQPLKDFQPDAQLVTHSPPEAFVIYLKIALLGGLVLASPFVIWQILRFITPGLKSAEKRWTIPGLVVGLILFAGGVLFAHVLVVPLALRFLWNFNVNWGIEPLWRVQYYFSFILTLFAVFGSMFELPLLVTIFARLGVASPEFLRQKRKYAIVLLVGLAAVLTPPDVVTQILLSVPLWILYEISILLAKLAYPSSREP